VPSFPASRKEIMTPGKTRILYVLYIVSVTIFFIYWLFPDEAVRNYREALQLCLENGDFDNAASASTNLAGIIANQDKMPEAITLLRNSLGYLQKKAHPDTEKITRLTLVQALGLQKESPEELIDVAEKLLNRFGHELAPDHIKVIAPYIDKAVNQYLQANSQIDPQAWKAAHFPRLYQ